MNLFRRRPKISTEEFCRGFYEGQVFDATIGGRDAWALFCETALDLIIQADPSFSMVDRHQFQRELTALRMEMFALAWMQTLGRADACLPQSVFTRGYLEGRADLPTWEAMGEYNQVVAQSVSATHTGEQAGGRRAERANAQRFAAFKSMLPTIGPEPTKEAGECVARVANRIGASMREPDCVLVRLLSLRLVERLGLGTGPANGAWIALGAVIHGFYKGSMEAIGEVSLAFR